MIPIPKGQLGNGTVKTGDLRAISLNAIISKLFEKCLRTVVSQYHISSDLQFGFKAKSSCTEALWSVRMTVKFLLKTVNG